MKLVSFNVNSVRSRLHQLQAVVDNLNPDVIGLQETKVDDENFPLAELQAMGYQVVFTGQKTHYGVALMSRLPMSAVRKGFPTDTGEAQKRLVSADVTTSSGRTVTIINGYFPQGEARDHPVKFPAKEKFYADLKTLLETEYSPTDALVVMGDFNVAPLDIDIGISEANAKRWLKSGKASFLPEERGWLQAITDWGLHDTYRVKYPDEAQLFSWFDYRSRGFERDPKSGLRIDQIFATKGLTDALDDAGIDYAIRSMDKPSDHCPIWSSFNER